MVKFRLYYDKDKEEIWINEMAREGWAMNRFCMGFYWFEPCEPGEYIYQIDLFTENKGSMTHQEYLELIKETGAEFVCRWFWYRIFRRRSELGDFKLYTDDNSRVEQYERFCRFFRNIGLIQIFIFLYDIGYLIAFWHRIGDASACFFFIYGVFAFTIAVVWRNYFKLKGKIRDLKQDL